MSPLTSDMATDVNTAQSAFLGDLLALEFQYKIFEKKLKLKAFQCAFSCVFLIHKDHSKIATLKIYFINMNSSQPEESLVLSSSPLLLLSISFNAQNVSFDSSHCCSEEILT